MQDVNRTLWVVSLMLLVAAPALAENDESIGADAMEASVIEYTDGSYISTTELAKLAANDELAERYLTEAVELRDAGRFLEAAQLFDKAAEVDRKSGVLRHERLVNALNWAAVSYLKIDGYSDVAFERLGQATRAERKRLLGDQGEFRRLADGISKLSTGFKSADHFAKEAQALRDQGKFSEAARLFVRSAEAERSSGAARMPNLIDVLTSAASSYEEGGQTDLALRYFQEALEAGREHGDERMLAVLLKNSGQAYRNQRQYESALRHLNEGLALARQAGDQRVVAYHLYVIAGAYYEKGEYEPALDHYSECLKVATKEVDERTASNCLYQTAGVYYALGKHDQALRDYQLALALHRRLGLERDVAGDLNGIGGVYRSWGFFDLALEKYQNALDINRRIERSGGIADGLNRIGDLYSAWGQYDEAIERFEEALAIAQEAGLEGLAAILHVRIGNVEMDRRRFRATLVPYNRALRIGRKLGDERLRASSLSALGSAYKALGRYDEAAPYYQQALEIEKKLRQPEGLSATLRGIAGLFLALGEYDKAIDFYGQALEFGRMLADMPKTAGILRDRGYAKASHGEYASAATDLIESVGILEALRETAVGSARRDFLASQVDTYELLTSVFVRSRRFANAFKIVELSRARVLGEQIGDVDAASKLQGVEGFRSEIGSGEAILVLANADHKEIVSLVATEEGLSGKEVSKDEFLAAVRDRYRDALRRVVKARRGTAVDRRSSEGLTHRSDVESSNLRDAIALYRESLLDVSGGWTRGLRVKGRSTTAGGYDLGRLLYDLLIKPIENELEGKQVLTIVPGGVLGLVPFETLIAEDGRYLIERLEVRYAQSVSTLSLLQKRKYGLRKPLLAFGGAIYDQATYVGESEISLASVRGEVDRAISRGLSLRPAYSALGSGEWGNLPGSLGEVRAIEQIVPEARVVTGGDVAESAVKKMSGRGELAGYRVLHFATHGLVVSDVPEMSALVLSQFADQRDNEDGYLRMGEIAKLRIAADFVNLSACETGLGKVYAGEGVVGIAQSFLIAGANSLSVSLWNVADASTAQFMKSVYERVETGGLTYAASMAEVKRRFIRGEFGEDYKKPYYWAPFVFYGN